MSRRSPGVVWVHNDSGDEALLYALGPDAQLRASIRLDQVVADDWEDLAMGPGPHPERSYLYVADIGDNRTRRRNGVLIHRIEEPELPSSGPSNPERPLDVSPVDSFALVYPHGPEDAETLLVDPSSGEVVIVTKTMLALPRVYYTTTLLAQHATVMQEHQTSFPGIGSFLPTGGDVSPDGRWVVVRGYDTAYLWQRDPATPLHRTFDQVPCVIPIEREPQGEAIGFSGDGTAYFTLSENTGQVLYSYRLADESPGIGAANNDRSP